MILYRYNGAPIRKESRDFCRKHFGEERTLLEWKRILHDEGLPFSELSPGGINCRHYLELVRSTDMQEAMHRTSVFTIQKREAAKPLTIVGTFTTSGLDTYNTRIVVTPEAWERAIPAYLTSSGVAVLEHKQEPIGIVRTISYEPKTIAIDLQKDGFQEQTSATCEIEITNPEVVRRIEAGELKGMSWGFIPQIVTMKNTTQEMIVQELRILEITITAFPANEDAHFSIQRSRAMTKINDVLRKMFRSDGAPAPEGASAVSADELLSAIADETVQAQVQALLQDNDALKKQVADLMAQLGTVQASQEEVAQEARNQAEVANMLERKIIAPEEKETVLMGLRLAGNYAEKRSQYVESYQKRAELLQKQGEKSGLFRSFVGESGKTPVDGEVPKTFEEFLGMDSAQQDTVIRSFKKANNIADYSAAYRGLIISLKGGE